jgi:LysM repeat protein
MRKEVKLGFAIGGVVLAVVIVWVLSVGGSDKSKTQAGAGAKATDTTAAKSITPSSDSLNTEKPVVAPAPAPAESVAVRNDAQPTTAPSEATASAEKSRTNGDLDWGKLLNGDQQIPLIAQTPSPAGNSTNVTAAPAAPAVTPVDQPKIADLANAPADAPQAPASNQLVAGVTDQAPTVVPNVPTTPTEATVVPPPQNVAVDPSLVAPTTRPAIAASRTHTVQKNETISSIAAAAYGSANYYPHILRANPNLDPKKLKVGMSIVLPEVADVKPSDVPGGSEAAHATATPAASRSGPAIDATKEYKVQPNDSLYKISVKLYGRSDMADKIYQLNKEKIGADPAKVKLGMVLKLPSAPTVTTSTSH